MSSIGALYSGLSGLDVHSRNMEVIGHNIANVGTTGFKSSRMDFETQLSRLHRNATGPGDQSGGTNPFEVGLGVAVAGTTRFMTQGQISSTGNPNDLAIDGEGFFITQRGDDRFYTRAGAFGVDADQYLVTIDGQRVLGHPADDNFEIDSARLSDIRIPVGARYLAEATTTARMAGNLNAGGPVAVSGSSVALEGAGLGSGLSLIGGGPITAASTLASIEDPLQLGTGAPLFADGQSLELTGVRKGSSVLPDAQMAVEAGTTVQQMLDFIVQALGIRTGTPNADGTQPGASVDATTGAITIVGNSGSEHDIAMLGQNLRLLDATGDQLRAPFSVSSAGQATGESVRTAFIAYDSLGNQVDVSVTMSLVGKDTAGTRWRYDIDSPDHTPGAPALASGELRFDPQGALATTDPIAVSIDRSGLGSATPLTFNIHFGGGTAGTLTALADVTSSLATPFRDGRETGILEGFSFDSDGTIVGSFSNALSRPLGRLPVAVFTNPSGLRDMGGNSFVQTVNSGEAVVVDAGASGAGPILSGSLEQSNVDIGREFIGLILTSTGYSAASRVIRTTDELMQQLLAIQA